MLFGLKHNTAITKKYFSSPALDQVAVHLNIEFKVANSNPPRRHLVFLFDVISILVNLAKKLFFPFNFLLLAASVSNLFYNFLCKKPAGFEPKEKEPKPTELPSWPLPSQHSLKTAIKLHR